MTPLEGSSHLPHTLLTYFGRSINFLNLFNFSIATGHINSKPNARKFDYSAETSTKQLDCLLQNSLKIGSSYAKRPNADFQNLMF